METQKRILIPGGKTSDWDLVNAAHRLGLYVITSGYNAAAPAHRVSDKYVRADYSDKEAVLKLANENAVDYMCSSANDIAMITTCYVCEKLGLPGHDSYETALKVHHKDKFKEIARKLRMHVPEGMPFDNEADAVAYAMSLADKVIVKPVDLVGGNGISTAETEQEKRAAIRKAFEMSLGKKIVIERFVEGTSHSLSAFIVNQKIAFMYCDNEYSLSSGFYMTTSAGPAKDFGKVREILVRDIENFAAELNLVDGRLHTQYMMDKDGTPYIIEITRRCSGDLYTFPASKALGFTTTDWIVKAECGMDCSDCPRDVKQKGFYGRHTIVTPHNGIIKNVQIAPELEAHIYDRMMWWQPGFEIRDSAKDTVGEIFYSFDSAEQEESLISRLSELITFEYA